MNICARSVENKLPAASGIADLGTEELLSLQQLLRTGWERLVQASLPGGVTGALFREFLAFMSVLIPHIGESLARKLTF